MPATPSIWWIRRDIRIEDNQALAQAIDRSREVVPLFIIDNRLMYGSYASEIRRWFLLESLCDLDAQLRERGSRLVLRSGNPREVLRQLCEETGAETIVAEEDFSPFARTRDTAIADELRLELVGQPTITHPSMVMKSDGTPYKVFTPYAKAWRRHVETIELLNPPEEIRTPKVRSNSLPTMNRPIETSFIPGRDAGIERLESFASGPDAPIYTYATKRDRLDLTGTSRLSAWLRFGVISAREAAVAAINAIKDAPDDDARDSAEVWLNELIWRDFYAMVLFHNPDVRTMEFQHRYRSMEWINDAEDIEAWKRGRTGYPVIDACMRQLEDQGWMHNRGRMLTASFLVKHLLCDWRIGEQHFMQQLIDGDPASNNGGWQWSAGTGTDAAPYFRVFNPITQGKNHDPEGAFVKHWLPELRSVETRHIHAPWTMSEEEQERVGCRIGVDYPAPIVDHQFARRRALAAYQRTG